MEVPFRGTMAFRPNRSFPPIVWNRNHKSAFNNGRSYERVVDPTSSRYHTVPVPLGGAAWVRQSILLHCGTYRTNVEGASSVPNYERAGVTGVCEVKRSRVERMGSVRGVRTADGDDLQVVATPGLPKNACAFCWSGARHFCCWTRVLGRAPVPAAAVVVRI